MDLCERLVRDRERTHLIHRVPSDSLFTFIHDLTEEKAVHRGERDVSE